MTYVLPVAVAAVLIGVPLRRCLAAIRRPHAAAVFAPEYGPGDCTRCGTTFQQYDFGMGERIAAGLEAGA